MFGFNFNHTNANTTSTATPLSINDLKTAVQDLTTSIHAGMTYTGDAYHYADLCSVADTINSNIISGVFAVTNITARLTGIIGLEQLVGNVTKNLSDNPSMQDIQVLFRNVQDVFDKEYDRAKKYKRVDSIEALKVVCGGKSLFTMAYASMAALYGKVTGFIKGHMPKIEFKNRLLCGLSNAIHRVGEVLHSGVRLVLKGLKIGLSFAAALAIQCGRVLTHVISTAVAWVRDRFSRIHVDTVEGVEEEMECSEFEFYKEPFMECVSNMMANIIADPSISPEGKAQYQAVQAHILMVMSAMELLPDDNQDKVQFVQVMKMAVEQGATLMDIDMNIR